MLCASGSFGIVKFENKQTAQGGQGAVPDVESGFKELIRCCPKYTTLFEMGLLERGVDDDLN